MVSGACFWNSTAADFRASNTESGDVNKKGGLKDALLKRPAARVTWLCALFLLGYVGVEVALGGWIVTFMIRVRHGGAFASGMTATGFWLGITVGRVVLGFVTPRVGEKVAVSVSDVLGNRTFNTDFQPGIYCFLHGIRFDIVASASILRIGRGGIDARVLSRPSFPGGNRNGHQASSSASSCYLNRVCRSFRR